MTTPGPVVWFEFVVNDLARASAFYRDLLGWRFAQLDGYELEYLTITNDAAGSVSGGLVAATDARPAGGSSSIYVGVPDLGHATAEAVRLGGTLVQEATVIEGQGRFAVVADPDGNHLGLWEM